MTVTIWHNPNCTKSRGTLTLLQEHDLNPEVRLYQDAPPSADEIRAVLTLLSIPAHGLIRTNEKIYNDLNLTSNSPEATLIDAMASHPILIQRPVVIIDGRAEICRPVENVLRLL